MPNKKRILVTGGAGYIGSVLISKLLKKGYNICIIDSLYFSDSGIQKFMNQENFQLINGDIRNRELIKKHMDGVDAVIHLAAIANDPSGELIPKLTRSINLDSYYILLDEAKKAGVKRFINTSSFSVYGIQEGKNITEDVKPEPLKEYSMCKADSEIIVKDYNSKDFTTSSMRLATICGWSPRMRFDLIVNDLSYQAIQNKKLNVWGGEQKRPQIDIQDICDYFVEFLSLPKSLIGGEIFNAGSENISIRQIAETINTILFGNLKIEYTRTRDDERSYHVSSEKISNILGLTPKRTINDSIIDIYSAYKQKLWIDGTDPIYHNVKRMQNIDVLETISKEKYEMD